jgi:hypothetical protein
MTKARFIGDPRNDGEGPGSIALCGLSFVKGEWVEVPEEAIGWLKGHDHFELEFHPLDHDQSGRKGGSRKRRS